MDAYLAEIEVGYDPQSLRRAWVRVYTNWPYLAPEQQTVFQARRNAAQQKIDGQFPGVNWGADSQVILYSNWCQSITIPGGGDTHGTCDNPLAPLNPTRPGSSKLSMGDFPEPAEEERPV
jgi:hypothetical protein